MDHHDHPEHALIETEHRAEEHPQALLGAVAKPCQELPVVLEIDAKHLRDAEDKLPMRHGVKDVVGHVLPELNTPLNPPSRGDKGG